MKLTVLGSGTSTGVPMIGCSCRVCTSKDPKDKRLRTSLLVEEDGRRLLIDSGPDFRIQALRLDLKGLDGVLYTHGHADHVLGLDDLRPLSFRTGLDIWAEPRLLDQLKRMFPYAFEVGDGMNSRPRLRVHPIVVDARFSAAGFEVVPLRVLHGNDEILGFRFGKAAYVTDCSDLPDSTLDAMKGLDVLFLDGLQTRPHPTHLSFEQAIRMSELLAPRKTYLIHIGHDVTHKDLASILPRGVEPAWDGLVWEEK